MRAYKFRIYPSKIQEKEMLRQLWMSKQLWNELLAFSKQLHADFEFFPTKKTLRDMAKEYPLYSQTKQSLSDRLFNSVIDFFKYKNKGVKRGFPRFKSIDRMKSLFYPQLGFRLENKLKVNPFGEIQIRRHRELKGKIKTLVLKKESSGKWFAIFTVEEERIIARKSVGPVVGLDLGLNKFATLSDGIEFVNPHMLHKYERKLALEQRKLSTKKKHSRNRCKQKIKVAITFEKIVNTRKDYLHKLSRKFVNLYSLIALEDLPVKNMLGNHCLAKGISDASWAEFSEMLCYKAESAGCKVVFVNPRNTSKTCSSCGSTQDMPLERRVFECCSCGMVLDRDLNAAKNILAKATVGTTERNACGVVATATTMKQDSADFNP